MDVGQRFEMACVVARLSQEPFAERYQFGQARCRLGGDDSIGLRQRQRDRKWPHKPSVDEIPRSQGGAGERNALTVNRGVDQHARPIQNRSMYREQDSYIRPFVFDGLGKLRPLICGMA
jgi:hypothetical protein